jgi:hypothetical protein
MGEPTALMNEDGEPVVEELVDHSDAGERVAITELPTWSQHTGTRADFLINSLAHELTF